MLVDSSRQVLRRHHAFPLSSQVKCVDWYEEAGIFCLPSTKERQCPAHIDTDVLMQSASKLTECDFLQGLAKNGA